MVEEYAVAEAAPQQNAKNKVKAEVEEEDEYAADHAAPGDGAGMVAEGRMRVHKPAPTKKIL